MIVSVTALVAAFAFDTSFQVFMPPNDGELRRVEATVATGLVIKNFLAVASPAHSVPGDPKDDSAILPNSQDGLQEDLQDSDASDRSDRHHTLYIALGRFSRIADMFPICR